MTYKFVACLLCLQAAFAGGAQPKPDSAKVQRQFNNIVRYNLSGPMLFGSNYIVFGYERVFNKKRSMSLNAGRAVLPKFVEFSTADFTLSRDRRNTGINLSLDYRFYLSKENKFNAPRGVYIGPFYAFNQFRRETDWVLKNSTTNTDVSAKTDINIHTVGAELGYQFVFWDRLAVDLVLIGPGVSNYKIKGTTGSNLSAENKEQLQEALLELVQHRFPGMDLILSEESFDANGNFNTWNLGYRYIFSVGFRF